MNGFYVSLRKTEIVNVDSEVHSLPPDNGPVKEYAVAEYPGCPEEWSKDGIFVPVEEGQPLWFDFRGNIESAVLVAVQRLNPVTGKPADLESGLSKDPKQNYLKLPDQLWIDGYVKDGRVYQFMVTKAGVGLAVNEFVLPKHMRDSHAIGFAFYPPKVERHPNRFRSIRFSNGPVLNSEPTIYYTAVGGGACACDDDDDDDVIQGSTLFSAMPINDSVEQFTASLVPEPNKVSCQYQTSSVLRTKAMDAAMVESPVETIDILEEQRKTFDKASMGMGGRIGQQVLQDNNTVEYYQDKPAAVLTVYLALPDQFKAIMERGRAQDKSRPDKYVHSGEVDGVQVPLIVNQ